MKGRGFLPRTAAACLFAILLLALPLGAAWSDTWQARVDWVPDGDTLFLQSGQKIRLKGIDAPETGGDKDPAQYYARESRKGLWSLVQGTELTLEAESLEADRYGRILAHVWLPGGKLLNEEMLARGLAFYYPHPGQGQEAGYSERLLQAQQRAMNQGLGFWPRILEGKEARQEYLGNKRSKRFHSLDCAFGQRISEKNLIRFSGLREAFEAGFAPGRKCTPWPLAD
ncbi:MAG: thermonuclease family protein [Thermodesulfobacteriota bacterium]